MSRIEINQLTKQFEHITALDGVTLNLEAGQIVKSQDMLASRTIKPV